MLHISIPTSTKLGDLDRVCNEIARHCVDGHYSPDYTTEIVGFEFSGHRYQRVHMVTAKDLSWRLWYGRNEGTLHLPNHANEMVDTGLQDMTSIVGINIPMMELSFIHGVSNPEYYLYCGQNWAKDKHLFMESTKTNGRLYEPRQYLFYRGQEVRQQPPLEGLPFYLVHSDEGGRQHALLEGDESWFAFDEIWRLFHVYLTLNVLQPMLGHPA